MIDVRYTAIAIAMGVDALTTDTDLTTKQPPHAAPHPDAADAPDEPREPCPSPLTAAEVLVRFRDEAKEWTLHRDGCVLAGRTWGQGPPLYFLGGLAGTTELFALCGWLLREQLRCVFIEHRRPLERKARRTRWTIFDLAADLRAVAEGLGDDVLSIFGAGFGGQVALAALLDHRPQIDRAVLQAGFAHRRLSAFERLLVRAARRLPGTLRRLPLREDLLLRTHLPWFPPFDAARWQFFLDDSGRVPIAEAARLADVICRTDLRGRLAEIDQPVLLCRTEGEGAIVARCQEVLSVHLGRVRSEWLHSSGQLPYLTHPHRLANLIRTFVLDEETA